MDQLIQTPMTNLTSAEVANNLVKLETLAKDVKARIDEYKARLLEEMKEKQVLSLKLETMTITRQTRKTVKVTDDALLAEAIKETGNQLITKTVVDMDYMKPLVTSLLEQGEVEGAQLTSTEYVSVKLAK